MISELNGWPACSPVTASPTTLRPSAHDSEAKMVRYTFLARLLHPLLHAGLARRLPRPLTLPSCHRGELGYILSLSSEVAPMPSKRSRRRALAPCPTFLQKPRGV